MTIYEQIIAAYPELVELNNFPNELFLVQDDSDGQGAFIAKWEYSKPIPKGLKLGK